MLFEQSVKWYRPRNTGPILQVFRLVGNYFSRSFLLDGIRKVGSFLLDRVPIRRNTLYRFFLFCRPSYFSTYKTPKKCRPSYSYMRPPLKDFCSYFVTYALFRDKRFVKIDVFLPGCNVPFLQL